MRDPGGVSRLSLQLYGPRGSELSCPKESTLPPTSERNEHSEFCSFTKWSRWHKTSKDMVERVVKQVVLKAGSELTQ
eukprot:4668349-Amphidinium_carterae.2